MSSGATKARDAARFDSPLWTRSAGAPSARPRARSWASEAVIDDDGSGPAPSDNWRTSWIFWWRLA